MQEIAITSLSKNDLEEATTVLTNAFLADPLIVYILPDEKTRFNKLRLLMRIALLYGLQIGKVFTTSKIEGVAIWIPSETSPLSVKGIWQSGILKLPFQIGLSSFLKIINFLSVTESLHALQLKEPHWYLAFLAVAPNSQRKGIGKRLVSFPPSSDNKLIRYLETTNKENIPFYQNQGFRLLKEGVLSNHQFSFWTMVKE